MSSAPAFIGIFILLAVALILIGGIVLIVLGLIGRRKGDTDGGACGACGYSVKGLEALHCPECGADLREVGIIRTGGGNAGKNAMLVMGIVMVASTFLCCSGLFVLGWSSQTVSHSTTHTITVPAQPAPSQPQPAPAPSP